MNDDEILDFVEFARTRDVHLRFIEYMPFTGQSNYHSSERFCSRWLYPPSPRQREEGSRDMRFAQRLFSLFLSLPPSLSFIQTHTHTHTRACIHYTYVRAYPHAHANTHTHTHTHTHTLSLSLTHTHTHNTLTTGNKWSHGKFVSYKTMLEMIRAKYPDLSPVHSSSNDTSKVCTAIPALNASLLPSLPSPPPSPLDDRHHYVSV